MHRRLRITKSQEKINHLMYMEGIEVSVKNKID